MVITGRPRGIHHGGGDVPMTVLLEEVVRLVDAGAGDRSRLLGIKESLEKDRSLSGADKNYVLALAMRHPGDGSGDGATGTGTGSGRGHRAGLVAMGVLLALVVVGGGLYVINQSGEYSKIYEEYLDARHELQSANDRYSELNDDYAYAYDRMNSLEDKNRDLSNELTTLKLRNQVLAERLSLAESDKSRLELDLVDSIADTNPVIRGLLDGEITYYVDPLPSYSTYDVSEFDDYLNGRHQEGVPLTRVYNEAEADFSIQWVRDYGPHTLGVAYSKRVATVGLGSSNCGEWQHFDNLSITKIAWHEIGHVLGFGHSDDPNNIMYPTTHVQYKRDFGDTVLLSSGWSQPMTFCNSGSQYFRVDTGDSGDGVRVFVITPDTDPSDFTYNQIGRYYKSCGELDKTWHGYGKECNIPNGAKLVIHNTEDRPVSVTYHMENRNAHPDVNMRWDQDFYEYPREYLEYIKNLR